MEKLISDYKISFTKGDTFALAIKFKSITEDLRSAFFTVKENPDDEPLIQKSLGAGIDKIDDRAYKNEKTYKLQIQASDTINLEAHVQYLYDLQVTVDNVVKTVLSGVFVVTQSVTGATPKTTATLEVAVDGEIAVELSTTPATNGIEYETDPVANAKIGDMAGLTTENKETLVKAINEADSKAKNANEKVSSILNGVFTVPRANTANHATSADSAESANTANHAGSAGQATYAQYASEDTSKGTIEERLNALGFKQGAFSIADESTVDENSIKKQGKYVIANLQSGYFTSCTVPEEFRPKEQIVVGCGGQASGGNDERLYFITQAVISPDGTVTFYDENENRCGVLNVLMQNVGWECN